MIDNENLITYNGVFVVGQCKDDISDCKGLRDVSMATKFGANRQKSDKNGHKLSCMPHINAQLGFERGFQL